MNVCLLLLLIAQSLSAKTLIENGHDFDSHQKTLEKEEVCSKIKTALQKDEEVEQFYRIKDDHLAIYASFADKQKDREEFALYFGNRPRPSSPVSFDPERPFAGKRIALDPGHIGGAYAFLEQRYIDLIPSERVDFASDLQFHEGDLTVRTACKLADRLRKAGAEVLMTKTEIGQPVYEKDFALWLEEDYHQAVEKLLSPITDSSERERERKRWERAPPSEIFSSTYNFLDLEKRAEMINAFAPDVTVSCHYNLGGVYDEAGKNPGIEEDYTLFFVPGAFKRGALKDEPFRNSSLKNPVSRYEFIRLLVKDDIEKSISLAKITQKQAADLLVLPARDDMTYLKVLCLKRSSGIYHRNLTLLRLIHGPVLYCEPLCQDNFRQALLLAHDPDRVIDKVVELYYRSLAEWFSSFPKQDTK